MALIVRSKGGHDTFPAADRWELATPDGILQILDGEEKVIGMYASGAWMAVIDESSAEVFLP